MEAASAAGERVTLDEETVIKPAIHHVNLKTTRLDAMIDWYGKAVGMTANEYTTIMNLSEAPNREMRMADLANATGLSASRTTRLVDDLVARGFIIKRTSSVDGRGNVAKLTPKGMAKLKAAWPAHLASVRDRVFDQLEPAAVAKAAVVLDALASEIADRNANPAERL